MYYVDILKEHPNGGDCNVIDETLETETKGRAFLRAMTFSKARNTCVAVRHGGCGCDIAGYSGGDRVYSNSTVHVKDLTNGKSLWEGCWSHAMQWLRDNDPDLKRHDADEIAVIYDDTGRMASIVLDPIC